MARQQYLPGLQRRANGFTVVWEPVFLGDDAASLSDLASRMPPSSRAVTPIDAKSPPAIPAIEALKEFVSTFVDCLVRSSSSETRQRRHSKANFDSAHDAWMAALVQPDGIISGTTSDLAELSSQIQLWRRPVALAATSPLRLCFRLEEPEAFPSVPRNAVSSSADSWHLRYLLQPHDDPSLMIPVEELWSRGRGKESAIRQLGPKAREYTLFALGQAVQIYSEISDSLQKAKPSGLDMNVHGAHKFLTEQAGLLEQAGFGVMLPSWWTRKGTKTRISVKANVKSPRMQGSSGLSLDTIVAFDYELALGDKKLTLRELEDLARLKEPLVRLRGQWVELSPQEIQDAIEFWKTRPGGEASVRDLVKLSLGVGESATGFDFDGVKATGWIKKLLEQLEINADFEELNAPKAFVGNLRPYQLKGYSWLAFLRRWGLGACLADDMGLGKTIQTLALIQRDWETNGRRPVLLVCPTTIMNNWQKEAARFTPDLPIVIHHGVGRKKGQSFKKEASLHAIVICSYGLLQRDIKLLKEVNWAGVVLDEAQNVKNPETKQSRAARSIGADYRIALTGTPVENNVGDLWAIMEFLNPGFLGNQTEFKRNFFVPIQANRDPQASERLKRITTPFILRRLKTDRTIISDLPEKLEMKVFCPLTREQASLYAAVLKEIEDPLESAEGIDRRGMILATLSKLKQVCNHPAQFLGDNSAIPERSGKLSRLTEMLEEVMEVGDRALVLSQFAKMGEILRRHLQERFGREVLFLHGGVSRRKRDQMVDRFQNDNGPPVFILSLKAGGTGLNLTQASHVFHFDRWWNPAVENQATDRAFRIGQTRNVQVHKFICAGTLEDRIDEMIERKKEITENVLGTGEGWLTELSNEEIRDVFALRKEALV